MISLTKVHLGNKNLEGEEVHIKGIVSQISDLGFGLYFMISSP